MYEKAARSEDSDALEAGAVALSPMLTIEWILPLLSRASGKKNGAYLRV